MGDFEKIDIFRKKTHFFCLLYLCENNKKKNTKNEIIFHIECENSGFQDGNLEEVCIFFGNGPMDF